MQFTFQHIINEPLGNILNELRNSIGLYAKCQLYGVLLKREGINYEINGVTGMIFLLAPANLKPENNFTQACVFIISQCAII